MPERRPVECTGLASSPYPGLTNAWPAAAPGQPNVCRMDRSSAIAMSIGTLGVVAAGTIAGFAVYNVASSSSLEAGPAATVVADSAVQGIDSIEPADLPSVPEVQGLESPSPSSEATEPAAPQASASGTPTLITKGMAKGIVLAESPGVPKGVVKATRKGYAAWAVQIQRADGSVITGYVDQGSGVIFDWTLDRKAPSTSQGGNGEYEEDEEHGDEHEGEDDD